MHTNTPSLAQWKKTETRITDTQQKRDTIDINILEKTVSWKMEGTAAITWKWHRRKCKVGCRATATVKQ